MEGNDETHKLIAKIRTSEDNAFPERAFVIHIEAFDWNCPQHITPRFTEEEVRGPNDSEERMNIAAIDETVPTSPQVSIRLEKKHPLAIRWMHWINFPVLFTMIWSGLLIYWNDSDNAYQHPHRVYRIGFGKLTLFRFFPDWFYKVLHVPYHVTEGLGYHFFFMWIFALNGIAWVLYTWISGEWRLLLPQRRSLVDAIRVTLVDLHPSRTPRAS